MATMSNDKKQQLKKYAVFSLMFIVFAGCMWLLFAPSDSDKEKEQIGLGFNADIPEPKQDEIIGDKKDAYEQAQRLQNKNERMRSLQDYTNMLGASNNNIVADDLSLIESDNPPKQNNRKGNQNNQNRSTIGNSVSAYQDINKTLGNFYDKPKDDPEKEELKRKMEELEAKMQEKEDSKNSMDEQLALMEKSYEMAAKYMPTNPNQGNPMEQKPSNNLIDRVKEKQSKTNSGKKTQVKPISNIRQEVVSALAQQYSNEELMYHYDQARNFGFSTIGNARIANEKNTIRAIVHDDQTLVDGQTIRLRLTEPLAAGTTIVPENSIVTGVAKIQGERLDIQITSLEYNGEIIPVEMQAYDTDGQRGIYIPGSLEMNAVKEIVANMGNSVGTSFTMTQSTGAQLTSDLTKGLIQGTSQYMNKKIKQVKVRIKSGYKMLLLPKEN